MNFGEVVAARFGVRSAAAGAFWYLKTSPQVRRLRGTVFQNQTVHWRRIGKGPVQSNRHPLLEQRSPAFRLVTLSGTKQNGASPQRA
jgi:hypothetical protein